MTQARCQVKTDGTMVRVNLMGEPMTHDGAPFFWNQNLPEEYLRKSIREGGCYADECRVELQRREKKLNALDSRIETRNGRHR
ncbi:hypothetical protein LCGC14_3150480 [marine sediment metagenome]|uniref:Uncharacterized protein n=1 Tax=marine sediment metagenome TaxID=412755 RepID=A0A0F8VU85_9ZZZZ